MSFQSWVVAQINGFRDLLSRLIEDSRSIPELEEKNQIGKDDYIAVYCSQEKKTKKFELSKYNPINAEYQKRDEIDQPNGYVGLGSNSKINEEFIPSIPISKVNGLDAKLKRDIKSISITGDTTKVLKLTKEDGTILQASFTVSSTSADTSSFYKEGSWSPTISKGVTTGLILGQEYASYTRIGNIVHYFIILTGVKTPVVGGDINITLPPSLPVSDGFGYATINKIIVGSSGVNTPSDVILEGVYSTDNKVYIHDRYGRNINIVFETPGTSLQISGTYKTNVYTP